MSGNLLFLRVAFHRRAVPTFDFELSFRRCSDYTLDFVLCTLCCVLCAVDFVLWTLSLGGPRADFARGGFPDPTQISPIRLPAGLSAPSLALPRIPGISSHAQLNSPSPILLEQL